MRILSKSSAAFLFVLFLTSLYYAWIVVWQHDANIATWGGNVLALTGSLISALWLMGAAKYGSRDNRTFWILMSLGSFAYFVAEVIWMYDEKVLRIAPPSPGWTDVFYNLQIVFSFAAFLYQFFRLKKSYGAFKVVLDILIVMTVAVTFSWHYLIEPILLVGSTSFLKLLANLSYPLTPLALLFGLVSMYLGGRSGFARRSILFLFLGLTVQILANAVYMIQVFAGEYVSGSLVDPFFMLGLLLVGYAGFIQRFGPRSPIDLSKPESGVEKLDIPRLVLPYVTVMVLFLFMFFGSSEIGSFTAGIGISIVLIVVRQLLVMIENHQLLTSLYRKTEELEQSEKRYRSLAYHDTLTGLANRMSFEERLKHTIEEARPFEETFAVAFIDLDRFKNVNDTLGHDVGDRLLVEVAKRLKRCIRESDFVARQGGDEFTLILRDIGDREGARAAAERILQVLIPSYRVDGHEISTPPSIGLSVYPIDDDTPGGLMKKADIALYQVKYGGKSHHRMYCETDPAFSRKFTLEKDLETALEQQQLFLHYQPQIDSETLQLNGVEALIRWNHPEFGLVSPAEFIPIAEDSGHILSIGEWVLRQACLQAKSWSDSGRPIKVGVNLSPTQLRKPDVVERVREILQETGLPPELLDLEITESAALSQPELVLEKLHALKTLGLTLSIDDFGTGYSSLSHLETFPIDKLKIARQFTSKLEDRQVNRKIVSHIIDLARTLEMSVIAEGVESENQAAILRAIECVEMQGFLFGRPVPATEIDRLLTLTPSE
ncbi:putative bifunctional diguanylate cyclase/phosphodiesterase [Saccharibacillus sacchari]|uniref:putative bifunctional diguanylate cyclase/phosphodiesterase n=1 Tax=Saccharibacillus sacchari TaxID=456493 RepID=UPI0030EC6C49